jgi:hypothetical protein
MQKLIKWELAKKKEGKAMEKRLYINLVTNVKWWT